MAVYADILILVNFAVDYFIIALAALILRIRLKLWRQLLAAFLGGLSSLYIFLPSSNPIIELTVHILICGILAFVCSYNGSLKAYFRFAVAIFAVNFAYTGAMIALWLVFKPYGMVINNSVIYFNISPVFLILFSVIGYFLAAFLKKLLAKKFSQSITCKIHTAVGQKTVTLDGIIDTGNSLKDVFGLSQIIISDSDAIKQLFGEHKSSTEYKIRYRAIPCRTIAGRELLDGWRVDRAEVEYLNKKFILKNAVLAESKVPLIDCRAIINPDDLDDFTG